MTITIYLALLTIVLRLVIDTLDFDWRLIVYVLLFAILFCCYSGIRKQRSMIESKDQLGILLDVKAGMRVGAFYALLMSIFSYIFYSWINPAFFPSLIESRADELRAGIDSSQTTPEEMEQIMTKFYEFSEFIFSAFQWATFTLFSLVFLSAFYSLIIALIAKKAPQILHF